MSRKLGVFTALTLVVAVAYAAPTFGGSEDLGQVTKKAGSTAANAHQRAAHRVSPPTGVSNRAVRGATLRYFETVVFPIGASTRDDSFMLCPRGFKAINGYFETDGGIVTDTSTNGSILRRWEFGLIDLTGQPGQARTGIVCLKGIN